MKITRTLSIIVAALIGSLATTTIFAADAPKMKMTTDIPPEITTPDSVETSIGTLRYLDGAPTLRRLRRHTTSSTPCAAWTSSLKGCLERPCRD